MDSSSQVGRLTARQARMALDDRALFKFAFVRHPLSRLVSAYRDKVLRAAGPGRWIIKRGLRGAWYNGPAHVRYAASKWLRGEQATLARGIPFRKFAALVTSRPPATLDPHWRPQTQLVAADKLDYVGRLESFATDFQQVLRRLGMSLPVSQLNQTDPRAPAKESTAEAAECLADAPASLLRARPALPDWRAFYDEQLAEQVGSYYRDDLTTFHYAA